jgi:hypothetical protein
MTCNVSHHKQTDPAIVATQNAMAQPAPDFSEYKKKERGMLDRLNDAHRLWKNKGKMTSSTEFSPYEIEKDRIIDLYKRWDLFEKSDPDKDGIKDPIAYYFRSRNEYVQEKERRIKMRPFKNRLASARLKAQDQSDVWYDAHRANEKLTGEELWRIGINADLFVESEKAQVYKEQGELQESERIEREARQAQDRTNFEIEKERAWEAQGDALASPEGILQPFAFGAIGGPVAFGYGVFQGTVMAKDAYYECKDGSALDCAGAAAPIAGAIVFHQALKSEPAAPNVAPGAVENELTMPRQLDLSQNFQDPPPVVTKPAVKPQDPVVTPPAVKVQDPVVTPPNPKLTQPPKTAETTTPPKTDVKPVETKPVEKTPVTDDSAASKPAEKSTGGTAANNTAASKGASAKMDPQQGVKDALARTEERIANAKAEMATKGDEISKLSQEEQALKQKVKDTPRSDEGRGKMLDDLKAKQKRLQELREQQEHRKALNDQDIETRTRLQNALDAKTYARPGFTDAQRAKIWEQALKDGDGKVISPSGKEIKPGDPWEVGHKPKYEFWKHVRSAAERGVTREEFLRECKKLEKYRPETPEDNASHAFEDKTDAYLGE